MALFFGIVEMGFLFKDYLAVTSSVRAGVRMASANPRTSDFAQKAADKVAQNGVAMNYKDVVELWVYKAAATTDKPEGYSSFSGCSVCVKFDWNAATKKFVERTGGSNSWASTSQNACISSSNGGLPTDRIGVFLKLKHDGFTKFIFNTVNLSDASILTLEPIPFLQGCK